MKPAFSSCGWMLLAAVVLLAICADAEHKRKKIVVFVPQKVKHIHHHHVKKVYVKPKTHYQEVIDDDYHRGDDRKSWGDEAEGQEDSGQHEVSQAPKIEQALDSSSSNPNGWRALPSPGAPAASAAPGEPFPANHHLHHNHHHIHHNVNNINKRRREQEAASGAGEIPQHIRDWVNEGFDQYRPKFRAPSAKPAASSFVDIDDGIRVQVEDVEDPQTQSAESEQVNDAPPAPEHRPMLRQHVSPTVEHQNHFHTEHQDAGHHQNPRVHNNFNQVHPNHQHHPNHQQHQHPHHRHEQHFRPTHKINQLSRMGYVPVGPYWRYR